MAERSVLRRIVGPVTTFLIGLGIAIGSGIFRTPSIVAAELGSPVWIIAVWVAGGVFVLASGLVTAELATRFPTAGGEYVYLREAYGELVAFLFGWGYTVFIVAGGAATIAAALGEATATLLGVELGVAPYLGALAILLVAAVNSVGLRAGAGLQNALTLIKVVALIGLVVIAAVLGDHPTDWSAPSNLSGSWLSAGFAAFLPVLWAYTGSTDAAKMAEEIEDVHRKLPLALIGAALTLTVLYVLVNVAYLMVLTPEQAAGSLFLANDVMAHLFGDVGAKVMAGISVVVFLGALSATLLATVRVFFALARDRLAFRFLARMSKSQSPVAALWVVSGIAVFFALQRGFQAMVQIYFLASAILFGLAYGSLIVFRLRDRQTPMGPDVFRCPAGPVLASGLILVQAVIALMIILSSPWDSLYTLSLLAAFVGLYFVWKRFRAP